MELRSYLFMWLNACLVLLSIGSSGMQSRYTRNVCLLIGTGFCMQWYIYCDHMTSKWRLKICPKLAVVLACILACEFDNAKWHFFLCAWQTFNFMPDVFNFLLSLLSFNLQLQHYYPLTFIPFLFPLHTVLWSHFYAIFVFLNIMFLHGSSIIFQVLLPLLLLSYSLLLVHFILYSIK